jgi:hypothetical protein
MTDTTRRSALARYPTVRDWIAVAVVFAAAAAADLALDHKRPTQQACASVQVSLSHAGATSGPNPRAC